MYQEKLGLGIPFSKSCSQLFFVLAKTCMVARMYLFFIYTERFRDLVLLVDTQHITRLSSLHQSLANIWSILQLKSNLLSKNIMHWVCRMQAIQPEVLVDRNTA